MVPLAPDEPTVVGPYRLTGRLGTGGMGTVYLAGDSLGRQVAVKLIRRELALDPGFRSRFAGEVANAQRVAAFCTARVLDHGEINGQPYLVTEFVEGPSLAELVETGGSLEPSRLHGLATGVATALTAIHAVRLVHRDLKPGNVLLSPTGPRIIDFGIARALDGPNHHTQTGLVVGSPGWIAPEQVFDGAVSPAVDVFAWGSLIAFAATGRHPYGSGNLMVLAARAHQSEYNLDGLDDEHLRPLVVRALKPDPAERPSASDLLVALVGDADPGTAAELVSREWAPSGLRRPRAVPGPAAPMPAPMPVPRGPGGPASQQPAPSGSPGREGPGSQGRGASAKVLLPVLAVVGLLVLAAVVGSVLLVSHGKQNAPHATAKTPAGPLFHAIPPPCDTVSKKTLARLAPQGSPKPGTGGVGGAGDCQWNASYRLPSDKAESSGAASVPYQDDPHVRYLWISFSAPASAGGYQSSVEAMRKVRSDAQSGTGNGSDPVDARSYTNVPGLGDEAFSFTFRNTTFSEFGSMAHVVVRLGNARIDIEYGGADRRHSRVGTDTPLPAGAVLNDARTVAQDIVQSLKSCSICVG